MLSRWIPGLGFVAWLAWVVAHRPALTETGWAVCLLLLAPLVLVPLARRPASSEATGRIDLAAHGVSIAALLAAFSLPSGVGAGLLALPWLAWTSVLAARAGLRAWRRGFLPLTDLVGDVAYAYLAVGAGWAVISRLGWNPLGFEDVIVLLTAIHFHHAGFVLPRLAARAAETTGSRAALLAAVGATFAVPLVAAGITASRLGAPTAVEAPGSWLLTASALLLASVHVRLARDPRFARPARTLFGVSALALLGAMGLAALYAARGIVDVGLDFATMRALHGTTNALGFALPALVAWRVGQGR